MDAAADASMALTSEASPSASSADDEREDATLEDEVDQYAAALGEARQENAALKANFESLREMHVALSEKCRALELNGSRSEADKRQKDVQLRNLQQLLEQWRAELETKQAALNEAKAQVLTHGQVEALRQKIISEIEGPHREQCAALEREAEAVQEQLNILRREHDRLRGEHEYAVARHAKELAEARTELDGERAAMAREADALKARIAKMASATTRATALEQELAAKARAVADLKAEVEAVRREKEAAANAAAAEVFSAANGSSLHADRLAELKRATEIAERRARHAASELAVVQSANEALNQQLMQAEAQLASSRASLEARARKHEEEMAAERRKAANAERAWEAERASLAEAHVSSETRMADLAREYKADAARIRAEAEAEAEAAQGRASAERRRVEGLLVDAKAKIESLEAARVADGKEVERKHDALRAELHAAQRDAVEARGEARAAQRAAEKVGAELEEARGATVRAREEADRIAEESRRHVTRMGELAQQIDEARGAARRHEAAAQAATAEAAEAIRKMEVARTEHELGIQALKRQHEFQCQTMIAKASEVAGDLETRYTATLGRARRKLRRAGVRLRGAAKERAQMIIHQGELDARNAALRRAQRGFLDSAANPPAARAPASATGELAARLTAMKAAADARLGAIAQGARRGAASASATSV